MKTYLALLLGMLLDAGMLNAVAPNSVVSPPPARIEGQHAADWVLVRFKAELAKEFSRHTRSEALEQLMTGLGLPPGARLREPAVNARLRGLRGADEGGASDIASLWERFLYLDLPKGLGVAECLDRLRGHPWLEYAEADSVVTPLLVPCDDDFPSQRWREAGQRPLAITLLSATRATGRSWTSWRRDNSLGLSCPIRTIPNWVKVTCSAVPRQRLPWFLVYVRCWRVCGRI